MNRRALRRTALPATLFIALGLTACGGGDEEPEAQQAEYKANIPLALGQTEGLVSQSNPAQSYGVYQASFGNAAANAASDRGASSMCQVTIRGATPSSTGGNAVNGTPAAMPVIGDCMRSC